MTLDEAIKHAEEVMIENLEKTKGRNASDPIAISCGECADNYRQLAKWLKELKQLREQTRWIPVTKRLPEEREWMGTKRFGTTISDEVYVTLETPDGERFTKHLSFQNGGLSQTDQEHMRVWFKGAVPIAWMPLPEPYKAD